MSIVPVEAAAFEKAATWESQEVTSVLMKEALWPFSCSDFSSLLPASSLRSAMVTCAP